MATMATMATMTTMAAAPNAVAAGTETVVSL